MSDTYYNQPVASLRTCEDCGYYKDHGRFAYCQSLNAKKNLLLGDNTIRTITVAKICPEYDDNSWMK